tara:strand:- start:927 stop:1361 length:435 start_codon:yes stop_codon:yes gene_type:complete
MFLSGLVLLAVSCLIITRVLVILCGFLEALYKCICPGETPNIWQFECCCFQIHIDYSNGNGDSDISSYCRPIDITRSFRRLVDTTHFHCCNQWGCMAKHFGCRCCRKSMKKIVPLKKNYSDHIIIINPYDNQYKLGTESKVSNV